MHPTSSAAAGIVLGFPPREPPRAALEESKTGRGFCLCFKETSRTGLVALTGRGFCSGFLLVKPPETLSEQEANQINKEKLG